MGINGDDLMKIDEAHFKHDRFMNLRVFITVQNFWRTYIYYAQNIYVPWGMGGTVWMCSLSVLLGVSFPKPDSPTATVLLPGRSRGGGAVARATGTRTAPGLITR